MQRKPFWGWYDSDPDPIDTLMDLPGFNAKHLSAVRKSNKQSVETLPARDNRGICRW